MGKKVSSSKQLYLDEGINREKLDKLKKKLMDTPVLTKVFLITIASNPSDQLDIIESKYLTYPYYNTHELHVVGLAKSNSAAVRLVHTIVQDCLDKQGNVDVKSFLLNALEE